MEEIYNELIDKIYVLTKIDLSGLSFHMFLGIFIVILIIIASSMVKSS